MNHVEPHFHYLRQLVQEKIVTLVYCKTNDQIADIFTKPLSKKKKKKFIKFHTFLEIQEVAIMGGCTDVISPPKYLECCVDGRVLEPQVLLVHHIFGSYGDN